MQVGTNNSLATVHLKSFCYNFSWLKPFGGIYNGWRGAWNLHFAFRFFQRIRQFLLLPLEFSFPQHRKWAIERTNPTNPTESLSKHYPLTLIINPPKINLSKRLAQENSKAKTCKPTGLLSIRCNVESLLGPCTTSTLRTRAKQRPRKKKKKKTKKHRHTNTSKLLFLLCVLGSFSLILLDPIGGGWIPSEQILPRHRIAGHIDGSSSC